MKKNKKHTGLWILTGILLAGACVILPGTIITIQAEQMKNQVEQTYSYAYSDESVQAVRMTLYERMKLMSGEWESDYYAVSPDEVLPIQDAEDELSSQVSAIEMGDLEAAGYAYLNNRTVLTKAEEGMRVFYEAGAYPEEVVSEYQNWYRPRVTLYQYVDAVFHVYSCYVWVVQYDYYDGSKSHTVFIDDTTGLILAYGVSGNTEGAYEIPEDYVLGLEERKKAREEHQNVQGLLLASYNLLNQYYADAYTFSSDYLEITEEEVYLPQYTLWRQIYWNEEEPENVPEELTIQDVCMFFEQHGVSDYETALLEGRQMMDNDKYLYVLRWSADRVEVELLPFTIKEK